MAGLDTDSCWLTSGRALSLGSDSEPLLYRNVQEGHPEMPEAAPWPGSLGSGGQLSGALSLVIASEGQFCLCCPVERKLERGRLEGAASLERSCTNSGAAGPRTTGSSQPHPCSRQPWPGRAGLFLQRAVCRCYINKTSIDFSCGPAL